MGPTPMQLVVVIAVRKAVSAATTIFTAISIRRPQPAVAVSISIATAKLVNIFHVTKYFDKNFQNIFNYFFLPAQGESFSCPESQIFLIFERL
jgi:hypothetical protein